MTIITSTPAPPRSELVIVGPPYMPAIGAGAFTAEDPRANSVGQGVITRALQGTATTADWTRTPGPPVMIGQRFTGGGGLFGSSVLKAANRVAPGNQIAYLVQQGAAPMAMSRQLYHRFRCVAQVTGISGGVNISVRAYCVGLGLWENFQAFGGGLNGFGYGWLAYADSDAGLTTTWHFVARRDIGAVPFVPPAFDVDSGVPLDAVSELEIRLGIDGSTPYVEAWINGALVVRNPGGWTPDFLSFAPGLELVTGAAYSAEGSYDMWTMLAPIPMWTYVEE